MDLAANKIPNKMLNGEEVVEVAVAEFRAMLKRDCMFIRTIAYKRVAFSISATFHFGYPFDTAHKVQSRVKADGVVEGEAPLVDPPSPEESDVLGLERDVVLENPNQARVHHGLPIKVQERQMPAPILADGGIKEEIPGAVLNPFPSIVTHELKYDPKDYPKGPDPVDRDVSDEAAARIGVQRRKK